MNKKQTILLSSKGLSRISNCPLNDMIDIVVGSDTYPVDVHLACYISPIISQKILSDPLFNKFHFSDVNEEYFPLILDLMTGCPIIIDEDNVDFLIRAGQIFGNGELIELCLKFVNQPLKLTNVISKIIRKYELKVDYTYEVEYAASNLFEFDDDELMSLELPILRSLLGCRVLQIRNESWLFSLVLTLIDKYGDDYRCLLGYVMFEALSDREMAEFIDIITLEDIDGTLWKALSERLMKNVANAHGRSPRTTKCFTILSSKTEFYPYQDNNSFDGVFANLSKKYGNLCENGIVKISSSGSISMPPNEIIDSNFTGYWYSTNVPNSWVMIDFGSQMKIKPNAYSLRSARFPPCVVEHLKSWVLEGSPDAKNWNELDRQKNTQDLNGEFKSKTWQCKELDPYRYIRLRQTSKNHHNSHFLFLNNIELFGTLLAVEHEEQKIESRGVDDEQKFSNVSMDDDNDDDIYNGI